MEIIKRVYNLEELFSRMEEKVEECKKEVEITPVLLSTPAWEFLGWRLIKSIYIIYFACLSVRLYPINVKGLNRSGPNFLCELTWPREGLWVIEFFKNLLHQNSIFKNLKIHDFFIKSADFLFLFVFLLHCNQRERVNWIGS